MRKLPPLFSLETHQANQIRSLKCPTIWVKAASSPAWTLTISS